MHAGAAPNNKHVMRDQLINYSDQFARHMVCI